MKDTDWGEWHNIVKQAKENILSNCPLIEDEIIIKINAYIREIENDFINGEHYF